MSGFAEMYISGTLNIDQIHKVIGDGISHVGRGHGKSTTILSLLIGEIMCGDVDKYRDLWVICHNTAMARWAADEIFCILKHEEWDNDMSIRIAGVPNITLPAALTRINFIPINQLHCYSRGQRLPSKLFYDVDRNYKLPNDCADALDYACSMIGADNVIS